MDTTSDKIAREVLDVVPAIMRTIRAEMRSRRGSNLSVGQFRALLYLDRNPGASLSKVAEHLGLTSPTVCKMIDGMVTAGLVTRIPSESDRRKVTIALTEAGETILESARMGTQTRLIEVMTGLSPEDRNTVHRSLQLLHALFTPTMSAQSVSRR
jgi:DNA-binding MarR family transcriptional regulator